jgi:hypothetical protein
MCTIIEKLDRLHGWDGYQPTYWKHRLCMDFMKNMTDNVSLYYLQLPHTDEFERKIRLKSCQNMIVTLKAHADMYEIANDQDLTLYHNSLISLVHDIICEYCKPINL